MVEHTQIILRLLPTNGLNLFDHFIGLALKRSISKYFMPFCLILGIIHPRHEIVNDELSGVEDYLTEAE